MDTNKFAKEKKLLLEINVLLREKNDVSVRLSKPLSQIDKVIIDRVEEILSQLHKIWIKNYSNILDGYEIGNWEGLAFHSSYDYVYIETRGRLLSVIFSEREDVTDYTIPEDFFDDKFIEKMILRFREYCETKIEEKRLKSAEEVKLRIIELERELKELKEKV